jgi:SAM-dependent methyltransferase
MNERKGPSLADRRYGLYDRNVRAEPSGEFVSVPPCIVCDQTRARAAFRVEGVLSPIVVCETCGLGRYHPMPGPEEIASFYPPAYYGEPGHKFRPIVESLVRLVGRRHVRFLARDLPEGAAVLDVGCGRGVLLGPLADMGFEVHGVEMSGEATRGSDPRAEIRIAPTLADAGYPPATFEEVILWHVLEHLPAPCETLEECHRLLKPGGKIIVSLPNFSSFQARWSGTAWFHLDPPRHLYHFPASGLWRLLERTGFRCLSIHHFSLRQNPFGWIQSAANFFPGLPRNAIYSLLYRAKGASAVESYGALARAALWGFLLGASPFALASSVAAAVLRSGATIHIVARRNE